MTKPKEGTQCFRVLQYMQEHGEITQMDCSNMHPPILRLASRISDLQHKYGYMVIQHRERSYNEHGKEVSHWAAYHLPTEEELCG